MKFYNVRIITKIFIITMLTLILTNIIPLSEINAATMQNLMPPTPGVSITEFPIAFVIVILFAIVFTIDIVLMIFSIKNKQKKRIIIGCIVAILSILIIFFVPVKEHFWVNDGAGGQSQLYNIFSMPIF